MKPFLAKDWVRHDDERRGVRPKRLRGPAGIARRLIDGQWRDVPVYESSQAAVEREERKAKIPRSSLE